MLLVPGPNCGPLNASELRYVGEAGPRPDPNNASPEEWRDYLDLEDNPAGPLRENWYCRACRQYVTLERDTTTNEFTNSPLPSKKLGGKA